MRERRRRRLPATAVVLTISACGTAGTAVPPRAEAAETVPAMAPAEPGPQAEVAPGAAPSGPASPEDPPPPPPYPLNPPPPPPPRNPPPPPRRVEAPPLAPGDAVRRSADGTCEFDPRRGESRRLDDCPTDLRMTGFISRAEDGTCRLVREFGGCPPGATCNPPPPLKLDCPPGSPPVASRRPTEPEGGR